MTDKRASPLALLALFLSGAAGLIDQVAWIRSASLVFGSTTHALSTVVAVFFLGLALGGWAFGRRSPSIRRPLLVAAVLEVVLAGLVLLTPFGFDLVEGLYGQAYRAAEAAGAAALAGGGGAGLWGARAGLVALVLLPPAFLMGGTLPLFARQWVADPGRIGRSIATLYATNTLGAAAGCALAGYALVPALGVRGSLAVAAGLNVAAAALLYAVRAPAIEPSAAAVEPKPGRAEVSERARSVIAAVLFLTGFVALAQEVVWARFLAATVGHGIHTVGLTLTLVLVGIVVGSAIASRLADEGHARPTMLGALLLAGGLVFWIPFLLPAAWWRSVTDEGTAAAVLVLPAAILAGASFPLAVRMVAQRAERTSERFGILLAVNTAGGIAGSILVGFLVLPRFGLAAAALFCAALAVAAGLVALALPGERRGGSPWRRLVPAVGAVLAFVGVVRASPARLPDDLLAEPARRIAVAEGLESNLAVVRGATGERVLEIDRWWQGQDVKTHQVMAAHLPMLLHPDPRRVLLVGVGAGQTPARFVLHDGLERLDCADIEPAVFDVLRAHFPHAWMDDPRVRLLAVDGRNHLTHTGERYDVISLEVGQLFRPGAASFYTRDFYETAREHLRPGGLVSQFVPLPFLEPDDLRSVIATFRAVFPQATLWYNTSELLLIGAAERPVTLDYARLDAVLADPEIAADLSFSLYGGRNRWHVRPEVIRGSYLAGSQHLEALAGGGRIERDDPPRLAYAVTRPRAGEPAREVATLAVLRRHLEPIARAFPAIDQGQAAEAERVREDNLREITTAVTLRQVEGARARGDDRAMRVLLEQAVAAQPGHARARRMLADALLLAGEAAASESAYTATLAIAEDDARAHGGLGLLLLTQGRFDESIPHLERAIAIGPDDASFRINLGAALVRKGDLTGAATQFERALVLEPSNADAQRNLATIRGALAARSPSPFTSTPADSAAAAR